MLGLPVRFAEEAFSWHLFIGPALGVVVAACVVLVLVHVALLRVVLVVFRPGPLRLRLLILFAGSGVVAVRLISVLLLDFVTRRLLKLTGHFLLRRLNVVERLWVA